MTSRTQSRPRPTPTIQIRRLHDQLKRSRTLGPHRHAKYELLYVTEGKREGRIGRRHYHAEAGDIVIVHPGLRHMEHLSPGFQGCMRVYFSKKDLLPGLSFPRRADTPCVVRVPWQRQLQEAFYALLEEHDRTDRWSIKLCRALIAQIVALVQRSLEQQREPRAGKAKGGGDPRVTHVVDEMNQALRKRIKNVPLRFLAREANLSVSRFGHLFKDITGHSPKQYYLRARLERAAEMLLSSDRTAAQIASQLRFSSPQYFTRVFCKYMGLTPSAYRSKSKKV